MKAADLIALLKDARGALHGWNHRLVERVDAAVAELEVAQKTAGTMRTGELSGLRVPSNPAQPAAPSVPRRIVNAPGPLPE